MAILASPTCLRALLPPSPELAAALAAARLTEPACSQCAENGGLCVGCADHDRALLPQLAVPSWVRLVKRAAAPELVVPDAPAPAPDPVAARYAASKDRRRARRAAEAARKGLSVAA